MGTIRIDFQKTLGKIKPMNAVNNGPVMPARMFPKSGTFEDYKAAGISPMRETTMRHFAAVTAESIQ